MARRLVFSNSTRPDNPYFQYNVKRIVGYILQFLENLNLVEIYQIRNVGRSKTLVFEDGVQIQESFSISSPILNKALSLSDPISLSELFSIRSGRVNKLYFEELVFAVDSLAIKNLERNLSLALEEQINLFEAFGIDTNDDTKVFLIDQTTIHEGFNLILNKFGITNGFNEFINLGEVFSIQKNKKNFLNFIDSVFVNEDLLYSKLIKDLKLSFVEAVIVNEFIVSQITNKAKIGLTEVINAAEIFNFFTSTLTKNLSFQEVLSVLEIYGYKPKDKFNLSNLDFVNLNEFFVVNKTSLKTLTSTIEPIFLGEDFSISGRTYSGSICERYVVRVIEDTGEVISSRFVCLAYHSLDNTDFYNNVKEYVDVLTIGDSFLITNKSSKRTISLFDGLNLNETFKREYNKFEEKQSLIDHLDLGEDFRVSGKITKVVLSFFDTVAVSEITTNKRNKKINLVFIDGINLESGEAIIANLGSTKTVNFSEGMNLFEEFMLRRPKTITLTFIEGLDLTE